MKIKMLSVPYRHKATNSFFFRIQIGEFQTGSLVTVVQWYPDSLSTTAVRNPNKTIESSEYRLGERMGDINLKALTKFFDETDFELLAYGREETIGLLNFANSNVKWCSLKIK